LIYKDIAPLVMAMPWPAAEGYTIKSPAGGNSLYVFGNNDAERAAAAKLVVFLTNTEANAEWAMNSGYLPTRQSALDSMTDFITGFDNYQTAVDGISNVVPAVQFPGKNDPLIRDYIMDALEAALLGEKDAATALTEANEEINTLLNE
jgi:sn-glycerol 3-phosphate transport system substrate-binding protein